MTRDVFAFTSGFPLAKAGRKAGADRFEEHGGAVMSPEQASADKRQWRQTKTQKLAVVRGFAAWRTSGPV